MFCIERAAAFYRFFLAGSAGLSVFLIGCLLGGFFVRVKRGRS